MWTLYCHSCLVPERCLATTSFDYCYYLCTVPGRFVLDYVDAAAMILCLMGQGTQEETGGRGGGR